MGTLTLPVYLRRGWVGVGGRRDFGGRVGGSSGLARASTQNAQSNRQIRSGFSTESGWVGLGNCEFSGVGWWGVAEVGRVTWRVSVPTLQKNATLVLIVGSSTIIGIPSRVSLVVHRFTGHRSPVSFVTGIL